MFRLRHLPALCAVVLGLLACPSEAQQDDGSLDSQIQSVRNSQLKRELQALQEAAVLMETVQDEETAKKAAAKLRQLFRTLPPPIKGEQKELEIWARAQNRVSAHMWRLLKEPYFVSSGLQEAWTLITDPFSRPRAQQ